MDPKQPHGILLAPSASGPAARSPARVFELPGERKYPRLDDHIVTPGTREEMVRGRRVIAQPANPPHADLHNRLGSVIEQHAAPGYIVSSDLLTRVNEGSNFATDTSVRHAGIDPNTGDRYLEELVFEVVSTQSMADIRARAEDLSDRGVRRVIAIFVKRGEVREWDPRENRWVTLSLDGVLKDRTLVRPVEIRALLDEAVARSSIVKALDSRKEPELMRLKQTEREEGRRQALSTSIVRLLEKRGLAPTPEQVEVLTNCRDTQRLERWLEATLDVASVAELLEL